MLRLTVVSQTKEEATLKVEGWLAGADVALLEHEGSRLLQHADRMVLDVQGVKSIDQAGIALLRRWWGERLVLRGASPFLHALLDQHGLRYTGYTAPADRTGSI